MFESISSIRIAQHISQAMKRVILAAPGVREIEAGELIKARERLGKENVTIITDCDEEVCRLGFGDIKAVRILQEAGCDLRQCAGLRVGVLVCDDDAWTFSPTALYVSAEVHSDETPNALRLPAHTAAQ